MVEGKRRYDHETVRLPKSLLEETDQLIGKRGFGSRAEVVKQALREYLDDCYRRGVID